MSDAIRPVAIRPEDLSSRQVAPPGTNRADIHKAAVSFEGLLISTMFQTMRKTVPSSGLLGDSGQAKGTLEYLLDQAIVDSAMNGGRTWGLAKRLEEAWMARVPQSDSKHPDSVQEVRSPSR